MDLVCLLYAKSIVQGRHYVVNLPKSNTRHDGC